VCIYESMCMYVCMCRPFISTGIKGKNDEEMDHDE